MDNIEEILLTVIANSGDSRCSSLEAIEMAKEFHFNEAREKLKNASDSLLEAHKAHTLLLTESVQRAESPVTFIWVHASNHLTQAEITLDMARNFLDVIEKLKKEEQKEC